MLLALGYSFEDMFDTRGQVHCDSLEAYLAKWPLWDMKKPLQPLCEFCHLLQLDMKGEVWYLMKQ